MHLTRRRFDVVDELCQAEFFKLTKTYTAYDVHPNGATAECRWEVGKSRDAERRFRQRVDGLVKAPYTATEILKVSAQMSQFPYRQLFSCSRSVLELSPSSLIQTSKVKPESRWVTAVIFQTLSG